MAFISRARRPVAGAWSEGLYWLDSFVTFVNLEKLLIIRGVALYSRGNLLKAFSESLRIYVIVISHVWLYWLIDRGMPGSISYVDYNTAAFSTWQIFTMLSHKPTPTTFGLYSNLPLRIRWINLFIADFVWIIAKILVGVCAVYATFIIWPMPAWTGRLTMPNLPLLIALFLISGLLGQGLGLVLQAARTQWPLIDAVMEVIMWFFFVTSGIYESYVDLPPGLAPIFSLNPMMAVIEYGRVAFHPGYPVGQLSLWYSIIVTALTLVGGFAMARVMKKVETP
jgi:ABC-type polysaccharide/polyol phosphate export permease